MKKTFEVKGVDLTSLYGVGDKNILFLESQFPLKLNIRGNNIFCQGLKKDINHFDSVLSQMIDSIKKGNTLSTKDITQLVMINESTNDSSKNSEENGTLENVLFYGKKGPVFPRTDGQKELVKSFLKNDIIISVGPAGTGKTFLAVAYALALLERHEIEKIIFCRPAVEAGESLGFLPGDLKDKIDPYLAPLYDALHELLPKNKIQNYLDSLFEVNSKLWIIEDDIRNCERNKKFDQNFIELARAVYFTNDKRSEIKTKINKEFDSKIVEVKSYEEY